jgi:DNA-binding NtrC family response regulator
MYHEAITETLGPRYDASSRPVTAYTLPCSKLSVTRGACAGKELHITKEQVTIGRSGICDLVLNDPRVSGTHFEIITSEHGFLLRDLGAKNGTRAENLHIKEIWLKPGTRIVAGDSELLFEPLNQTISVELSQREHFGELVGSSLAMRKVFAILARTADTDLTILIQGETGTGKELTARAIHNASLRSKGPFIVQDCATIASNLVESTLFGHVKGAFTGADKNYSGCFEQAHNGTLFLGEIGDLDLAIQSKLLHVLEHMHIQRMGDHSAIPINVRLLAATKRDLRTMVNAGQFREDLYFRLCSSVVILPALRDRNEDIPLLTQTLLKELQKTYQPQSQHLTARASDEALNRLQHYPWPGNVRELKNTLAHALSMSNETEIGLQNLTFFCHKSPALPHSSKQMQQVIKEGMSFKQAKTKILQAFEASYLRLLMERHHGNITRCAQAAGLTRYHLRELTKRHGIKN